MSSSASARSARSAGPPARRGRRPLCEKRRAILPRILTCLYPIASSDHVGSGLQLRITTTGTASRMNGSAERLARVSDPTSFEIPPRKQSTASCERASAPRSIDPVRIGPPGQTQRGVSRLDEEERLHGIVCAAGATLGADRQVDQWTHHEQNEEKESRDEQESHYEDRKGEEDRPDDQYPDEGPH